MAACAVPGCEVEPEAAKYLMCKFLINVVQFCRCVKSFIFRSADAGFAAWPANKSDCLHRFHHSSAGSLVAAHGAADAPTENIESTTRQDTSVGSRATRSSTSSTSSVTDMACCSRIMRPCGRRNAIAALFANNERRGVSMGDRLSCPSTTIMEAGRRAACSARAAMGH